MDEIEFFDRQSDSESTALLLPQVKESLTITLPLSAQEQLIRKADMISKLIIALEQKEEGKKIQIEKQVSVEYDLTLNVDPNDRYCINPGTMNKAPIKIKNNVIQEFFKIKSEEGVGTLFLGIKQRLIYVGLANGIRLAAYGTSRMDLMMRSLDDL